MITSWRPGNLAFTMLILMTAVIFVGCSGGDESGQANENTETTVEAASLTSAQEALVQQAATMADAIAAAPESLDSVLAENQMSSREYQAMIYKISADPVMAKAYQDARTK